jgi:hypothetical protein
MPIEEIVSRDEMDKCTENSAGVGVYLSRDSKIDLWEEDFSLTTWVIILP